MAEGAVRPLLAARFTPQAAHNKLESVCGGSFSSLILRMVFRSLNACISGRPPWICGLGNAMPAGS
jgi:hypothetical protein